ncbi:MAG TPA: DUF58 domain-containing protein [Polyangiales bacterium]|nr:DUF58 domain-containing protein [Polyangiales bacterium]
MTEPAQRKLLDQELAERVASLHVRATRAVDGIRSGIHRSPHRGASMVFAEHRDYRPGDDLRTLDWRVFARNDRYTVKHFEQETHLRASLLLDLSASMAFDGGKAESQKAQYAATLLAALSLILLGQGDAVGAYAFDADLRKALPARNRADHLSSLLSVLALPPVQRSAAPAVLANMLTAIGEHVGRRGLVVLASDLIDETPNALGPLSHFAALGHEVIVLHVLHPQEIEFPFANSLRFEDPEHEGVMLEADAESIRKAYRAELAGFLESCKQRCVAAGARYALARTDRPAQDVLASVLLPAGRTGWA